MHWAQLTVSFFTAAKLASGHQEDDSSSTHCLQLQQTKGHFSNFLFNFFFFFKFISQQARI